MKISRTWLILALLLLFAAGARLFDLRADPPPRFAEASQDFTTDGAYLTLHARNAALTGSWDSFGYEGWIPFKISLVSGLSYLLFVILGVSRNTANLTGTILNLGALVLFVAALRKQMTERALLYTSFFLAINFVLWLYGRLPFSENGMLFLAAAAYFAYACWFDTAVGKVTVGVLIALCGLLGKSFGFLLIVGPLITILRSSDKQRFKSSAIIVGSMGIVAIGFLALVYRGQGFLSFLWEHGAGEHGFPHGFESIGGYFENLISFARTGLHVYTPVLSLLAWMTVLYFVACNSQKVRVSPVSIFMLTWLAVWLLVISPFNYRPLRYEYALIIPMATLAGWFLDSLPNLRFGLVRRGIWWRLGLLLLLCWYFAYNVITGPFVHSSEVDVYYRFVWYSAPVGLTLAGGIAVVLWTKHFQLSSRISAFVVAIVLVVGLAFDGALFYRWLTARTYGIADANRDLPALVSPKAVFSGQYGPAIAEDSKCTCFPFFVTYDNAALANVLSEYPITHLAVSADQWKALIKQNPNLRKAQLLTRVWVRDVMVSILRVDGIFPNRRG
ncbi:MAG TPA: hypothetical protein VMS71_03210, partial [Candidatus Acidoferrum sp.]|nr:hypothetical protein [Candidatus Acidoferrum sp.]